MTRLFVLMSILLCAACSPREGATLPESARADLAGAERFEIMALDPLPLSMREANDDEPAQMHGYAILSRADVTESATREEILSLIERGAEESDGTVAACFNPRHGIRAERGDRVSELVICFECLSLKVFENGAHSANLTTTESPTARMNAIWKDHGCEVAGSK